MSNPWMDDPSPAKPNRWLDNDEEEFDPNRDYFTQVVEKKEYDMMESTKRSLQLLNESEQVGTATAEELLRQGEALKRTEKRVDQMEQDLKESDKHIQSIKSIWGAFVNKFRKEPAPPPVTQREEDSGSSRLQLAVTNSEAQRINREMTENHPVLVKQDEARNLYTRNGPSVSTSSRSDRMKQVDDNLDQMSSGLSRLKLLGIGLGEEIETQDKVITRLGDKVNRVDEKTHKTNKELIKLNRS